MANTEVNVLLLLSVILTRSAHGFKFPTNYSTELARYSAISTTSLCTNGGSENCNTSCQTRTNFPMYKTIKSISSNCTKVDELSSGAWNISNGVIKFDSTTQDCPAHEENYFENKQHFSITMWIKATTNTNIFSIGAGPLVLQFQDNKLKLTSYSQAISTDNLTFIVVRYNDDLSWFVNGAKVMTNNLSFTASTKYNVKLGPGQNLTTGSLIIVDVRWYSHVITDREILYMYKGEEKDFCRCPPTHPTVVKNTFPVEFMKCTNGNSEVLRLGANAYLPEYMSDDNATTKWVSGTDKQVNITIMLKKQFQMKRVTLIGITNKPASLKCILFLKGTEVQNIEMNVNSSHGWYDFDEPSTLNRTQYKKFVADKVIVQAKFNYDSYLTVSDLKLEARCSCYGNDDSCTIVRDNYTCNCAPSSKTKGSHCEKCNAGYFRSSEHFKCNLCGCNVTGSLTSTSCMEVDGKCACQNNIEGRTCSVCKHNTANFSRSGCQACSCNPNGITSCSDDFTCNCKQNVETTSGKCNSCLPNYYDIASPSGCTACDCDDSGTRVMEPKCDSRNGVCYCRANVAGDKCRACKDGYYGLSSNNTDGCDACECNIVGSNSSTCDKVTGQCPCVDGRSSTVGRNRLCIPTELKLEPLFGPKVGSTLLTLSGQLLGTNANVTLTIGGVVQSVAFRNITTIIFNTTESTNIENKEIRLIWSYGNDTYNDDIFDNRTRMFEYKNNPQMIAPTSNKRTFASGGCIIQVTGTDLDSVAYPKLRVYLTDGEEIQTPCNASEKSLKCPTPRVDLVDKVLNVSYGFWLDGVTTYQNVTQRQNSELIVVKDPTIYNGMSETFRNTFDDILKIKGERLNDACHDSDVSIILGDKNCTILSRHDNVITCDPGETFPGTARSVTVKVKIGNLEVIWGTLKINSFWTNTEFIYIAVGAGVFFIIIITVIVCIVRCRRRSESHTPADDSIPLEIETRGRTRPNDYTIINPVPVIQPQSVENNTMTPRQISDKFCNRLLHHVGKVVSSSVIEISNIDPGKVCTHKGKKIRVINGQYNASASSPYSGSSLTIKTLVERYPEESDLPDWLNNGLLECTRLQDFDNVNVLKMKGIAIDSKNIYILYPEMSNKTLKDYLVSVSEPLSAEKKLEICIQVCEGMDYLSSQSFVHKDLAARNCWVSRDFVVKISDASFTYDLYPEEYLHSNGRYQPVRWMSPESLRQGFYDTKSDVWSYGVVIWEVFTNGYLPYHDITDDAMVKKKVCDEHFRLGRPHECYDAVDDIIKECQKDKSENRPNFFVIQNMLDSIVNPPTSSGQYANQQELAGNETGMEDYENLSISPPPRPPKGHRP